MSEQGATSRVGRLIDGQLADPARGQWHNVAAPASRQVLARVPFAPTAKPNAPAGARMASRIRRKTPIAARVRSHRQPVRKSLEKLAALRTAEQSKPLAETGGDGARGLRFGDPAPDGKPPLELHAQTRTVGPVSTTIPRK